MAKTNTRSITLPLEKLKWMLRGALPAMSTDDVTPVLTGVHWDIGEKWVTLTTTDRYRVHQTRTPRPPGANLGSFLMSGVQAKWLARTSHPGAALRGKQVARITWAEIPSRGDAEHHDLTASVLAFEDSTNAFTYRLPSINGRFPPVGRLFDRDPGELSDETVDKFGMSPAFLGDLERLIEHRGAPMVFYTPQQKDGQGRLSSPMLAANNSGTGWTARALIQPYVILPATTEEKALKENS